MKRLYKILKKNPMKVLGAGIGSGLSYRKIKYGKFF